MEENTLALYDEAATTASERTSTLTTVMRAAPTVANMINNMPHIVQAIKEIRLAQLESKRQLEELKLRSDHNLHKFDKIIKGAESRLDRQLDEMREIRQQIRQYNLSKLSSDEVAILSKLNDNLNMINSQFMYELQMLYNL